MSTHIPRRRGNTTTSNMSSSSSSSEDAITPCPPHSHPNALLDAEADQPQQPQQHRRPPIPNNHHRQRPTSWRSTLSLSSSDDEDTNTNTTTAAAETDPETLWRRMLALQRMFGCYNSARMRAALDQDPVAGGGVPSRTCLDLLNDSIDTLPEEERKRVEAFLEGGTSTGTSEKGRKRGRGTGWRGRFNRC
ncbi:hypothetical protein QBC39DRAFT_369548 [Podospora conica]|nr:hypothetical protein QBC39DRAFT_369548 [Schizothecium conicum]